MGLFLHMHKALDSSLHFKTNPEYNFEENSLNFTVAIVTILGNELRALYVPGKYATTELHF